MNEEHFEDLPNTDSPEQIDSGPVQFEEEYADSLFEESVLNSSFAGRNDEFDTAFPRRRRFGNLEGNI